MFRKTVHAVLVSVAMIAGLLTASAAAPAAHQSYIVVLDRGTPNVPSVAAELAAAHGGQVGYVYEHAIQGFSMTMSSGAAASVARNPRVAYVVEDMPRSITVQTAPTGIERIFADDNSGIDIDATDDFRVDVDVAVIDTGIDWAHPDLNVVDGINCANGSPFTAKCSGNGDDDHYHGTHVAGTIGALDNGIGVVGVAPGARLHAVKVLKSNGSGYTSWIVAGIDWVTARANVIEVANMSLGGSGFNQAEYDAIQGAVEAGVAFAVAAGNSDADANNFSPAAFDNVLTVSALADFDGAPGGTGSPTCRNDQDDTLADFSNWGNAVQIAAPGVCILSTYPIEQGEYGTISGTSMASPHAAGALALLASTDNPANASDVFGLYDQVIGAGNLQWTDDSGDGIKEPLLDVSSDAVFSPSLVPGSGGGGGEDAPPSVLITSPDDGASFGSGVSISFTGSAIDDVDGDLTANLVWTSSAVEIGTGGSFSATLSDGEHVITAATTDSASQNGSDTVTITVGDEPEPPGDGIALSVSAYKVRGLQKADLTWTGATSTNVDVRRDGAVVATVANSGAYTDNIDQRGGGSYTYQICEAGSSVCSNEVTASY
ncbi:MAG: S8 family serine peptidase [Acidimicrobiia bacterium]